MKLRLEYGLEAALLATFLLSACLFASTLPSFCPGPTLQGRGLMGLAMGTTALVLLYSPWGKQSGAHMNPAVSLTYWSLGRMPSRDLCGYVVGQFSGALAGVALAHLLLGERLAAVNFARTAPGSHGTGVAWLCEALMALAMMYTVLRLSNSRWERYTGLAAAALVATYITFLSPLSGMSLNPARSFGSAWFANNFAAYWIYATAPPLGMLLGAGLYRLTRRPLGCPKLYHHPSYRCIFCGRQP